MLNKLTFLTHPWVVFRREEGAPHSMQDRGLLKAMKPQGRTECPTKGYGTPQPRGGIFRVARGGSWSVEEDALRCSFRMSLYANTCDVFTGVCCICPA
jgi:hypothetical protein